MSQAAASRVTFTSLSEIPFPATGGSIAKRALFVTFTEPEKYPLGMTSAEAYKAVLDIIPAKRHSIGFIDRDAMNRYVKFNQPKHGELLMEKHTNVRLRSCIITRLASDGSTVKRYSGHYTHFQGLVYIKANDVGSSDCGIPGSNSRDDSFVAGGVVVKSVNGVDTVVVQPHKYTIMYTD